MDRLAQEQLEPIITDMVVCCLRDRLEADKDFAQTWSDLQTMWHMNTGFDFKVRVEVE